MSLRISKSNCYFCQIKGLGKVMATIGALYRRVDGFNASMHGFWDYWKHDILIQIGFVKSEDSCLNHAFGKSEDL
jgi:hypothetical protein